MNANGSTYYMGAGGIRTSGPVATSGSIALHSSVFSSAGHTVTSVKIKEPVAGHKRLPEPGGERLDIALRFYVHPAAGQHTYYVYVTMNSGDELWSAPIWINQGSGPDTTAPVTSIMAPTAGSTVKGSTTVTASASDNVGVTKVEFYLDGLLQSTSVAAPYSRPWNTVASADGAHTLATKAYDAAGNIGNSAPVGVTVDNTAPATSITSPAAGATVSGTVSVTASASDNFGVTKVEFYLDGTLQSTSTASPYSWSWNSATATTERTHLHPKPTTRPGTSRPRPR